MHQSLKNPRNQTTTKNHPKNDRPWFAITHCCCFAVFMRNNIECEAVMNELENWFPRNVVLLWNAFQGIGLRLAHSLFFPLVLPYYTFDGKMSAWKGLRVGALWNDDHIVFLSVVFHPYLSNGPCLASWAPLVPKQKPDRSLLIAIAPNHSNPKPSL